MSDAPLRICMFGTYEAGYDRNQILMRGLRDAGVEVYECHQPVWETMRYKTSALKGPAQYVSTIFKLTAAYVRLLFRYLRAPAHDIVFVGYLGHFDVPLARLLSWIRRKPLVFDAFVSLYDTSVEERAVFEPDSLPAKILWMVDRWSCKLADLVLLDTNQHIDYFCDELALDRSKFQRLLVGADPAYIATEPVAPSDERFVVLHYAKFAPLHGLCHILDAADSLRDESDVVFKIVGGGQTYAEGEAYARRLGLENLDLIQWLEPDELRKAIREAHVCLGIFGDTPKAGRVVPNKVYQCLAGGAAVVTRRSPAAEEVLTDRDDVLLCEAANGTSLAEAISELKRDPALREHIGQRGARLFRERFMPRTLVETELLPRLRALL